MNEKTYCMDCHLWTPKDGDKNALYGRCKDLKQRTMRLDFCDTDKIPKKKEASGD